MNYRQLGCTGVKVSELCMGTMTFGSRFYNIGQVDQKTATHMIEQAVEAGINFFDTADVYSYGQSEKMLGKALKELRIDREAVVIATKVRSPMSKEAAEGTADLNNVGLSRKHIISAVEASLRRLNTDYIDLYQVHGWDSRTPLEETLRALEDLVRDGKVLYLGCSNWTARHLAKALAICQGRSWARFASLQAYYSLVGRDLEHELLPLAREEKLGVLPWSPLAGGFLTGKYRHNESPPKDARRVEFDFPPIDAERSYDAVDVLDSIASEVGGSIPQVALAWLLAQPAVTSVIIGAKRVSQLEDNLGASNLTLSADQLERLDSVTRPVELYPEWMVKFQNAGR